MKRILLLAGMLTLSVAPNLFAQAAIDTIPAWNGTTSITTFGVPNTATYGETIILPVGTGPLQSFSFEIGNCTAQVDFRGEIFAWNPGTQMATGPSLFESPVTSVPAGAGFTLVTFNTGLLALPPGNYVFFASTSQDQTINTGCAWGSVGNNTAYTDGQFVFQNNGTATAQWTTVAWNNIAQDLAFRAVFQGAVPTMSTWATILLAVGLMGLVAWSLRARRLTT